MNGCASCSREALGGSWDAGAHGTQELHVTGLITPLTIRASYVRPARETISKSICPVRSSS